MDTKDNVNSIRYRLLELRGDESQQDLADEIGVSRSLVKAWESGDRKIKIDDLISLSKHFHVSADYLLGLTDARTDDRDVKFISDYTGLSASTMRSSINTRISEAMRVGFWKSSTVSLLSIMRNFFIGFIL